MVRKRKKGAWQVNCVICDDDPLFAMQLEECIKEQCVLNDWEYHCRQIDVRTLLELDFSTVDVLFLDIEMPEINGLEAAKQIRQRYGDLLLVFVTGFIDYAPSGYKVNAFRYLLKSKLDEELPECLMNIQEKLYSNQESIWVKTIDGEKCVRLKSIVYLEGTSKKHTLFYLYEFGKTVPIECLGLLSFYEKQLQDKGFLKIQKSYLINMEYIRKMANYHAVLKTNEELKTSISDFQEKRQFFLSWKEKHL